MKDFNFRHGDAKSDVFATDAMINPSPVDRIPEGPTTPQVAYQMVKDETYPQTQPRLNLATFVHPLAYVAPDVTIEPGVVIMPYAMISSATQIGMGTLIMTGVTIGHDTKIGKFNHIASQAVVGSYLDVSDGVHFGLNCTVREHLTIGENSTIGMGAVLTKNVGNSEIWIGSPAFFLRKAE